MLKELQDKVIVQKTERSMINRTIMEKKNLLDIKKSRYNDAQDARVLLQQVAKVLQSNLEFHISGIVTSALDAVFFDDPCEFIMRFVERRNKTECDLLFIKNGNEMKPIESSGGGEMDVASLALRIAFWSLNKNRPVMILDEPTKYVSVEYQEGVSEMLKMLSDKLGIQFIIVTHQKPMAQYADKVFTIRKGELTQ